MKYHSSKPDKNGKSTLIMTVHVGEATKENGEKIQLLTSLNTAPIIRFEDGVSIIFDWQELVEKAIEFKEETEKNEVQD